jgi:hypothetical protein
MVLPKVEALNDVGLCLFAHCRPESLFCCAVLPEKGYVWLTKGAEAGSVLVYWVVDAAATPNIRWIRRNHLVFDLDETLIFNPPNIPRSLRNMDYVNPVPPHYISEPSDKAVLRPHVKEFLELVCPYFDQVRTCSFSVHSRALRIVQLLDPSNTTLLKNWSEATKMVFAREDILASALGGNSQSGAFATPGGPVKKSLRCCQLPVKAEQCTLILDDIPQVWPAGVQDNIIPILGPDKARPGPHDIYMNGVDGGHVGQQMLLTLVNLAAKSEGALHLVQAASPISLAPRSLPLRRSNSQPPPAIGRGRVQTAPAKQVGSSFLLAGVTGRAVNATSTYPPANSPPHRSGRVLGNPNASLIRRAGTLAPQGSALNYANRRKMPGMGLDTNKGPRRR